MAKLLFSASERAAIFAGYLIRVNHIRTVADSQYVNLFLNSHVARQYGNSVKTDGVNQSNINATKLSNYPFPYCSIDEQHEMVRILEKALSLVDTTEAEINRELQKAAALRQSILKQAFSGQLVAQDPNDEPASLLLERIKAEKLAQSRSAKPRKDAPARQGNGMTGKLPINLDHLLRHRTVEGERIEYKAGWNPKSVLHAICAFANDFHNLGGGYVILGVKQKNGRPVLPPKGISSKHIDAIQNELLDLGHSAMRPHYHPLTATYSVKGRTILVLWAPGGETRPYKARVSLAKGRSDWGYFIRKHSSTVRARDVDERELLALAATVPFDDRYRQASSPEDISFRLIEQFLRDVGQ